MTKRGRKPRPGRHGWQLWVMVEAQMRVHDQDVSTACNALAADKRFKDIEEIVSVSGSKRKRIQVGAPRSGASLRTDYLKARDRYQDVADRKFRDDCDHWLPYFVHAMRTGRNVFDLVLDPASVPPLPRRVVGKLSN